MEKETLAENGKERGNVMKMKTKIIEIDPKELKLLEVNARFMRHEEFMRLVENVKRDGGLTSVPFACKDGDKYLVLSGNHRVKAAISAGLEKIQIMVTDDELTKAQQTGIQLSHNSIVGEDDPYVLKQLYESIDDIDWKAYSGLDDKTLDLLTKVSAKAFSEVNLSFQTLAITFLPEDLKNAEKVIDDAIESSKFADKTWLTSMAEYDRWLDAQDKVSSAYGVKNVSTALDLILKIFEANKSQLSEVWEENLRDSDWVSIETIIGREMIPVGTAKTIKKAVDKMLTNNQIDKKNMWKSVEIMAKAYLGEK